MCNGHCWKSFYLLFTIVEFAYTVDIFSWPWQTPIIDFKSIEATSWSVRNFMWKFELARSMLSSCLFFLIKYWQIQGAIMDACSLGPISFIFMQFLGKIWSNNWLSLPPLLGNPESATVKLSSYRLYQEQYPISFSFSSVISVNKSLLLSIH